ncbi:MAG: hypothetical protein AAGK03_03760 [Pseudomonadota bacterium]
MLGDILDAIKMVRDGRNRSKDDLSDFLEIVAQDANILADIWNELLNLYRSGADLNDIPNDVKEKLRAASFNQVGAFGELVTFYEYFLREYDQADKTNRDFILAMTNIVEGRNDLRSLIGEGYVVHDWEQEAPSRSKVDTLEKAALAMKQEAARLTALAKLHKVR